MNLEKRSTGFQPVYFRRPRAGSPCSVKLIAATASPRRHTILKKLGVAFEVIVPHVEEIHDGNDPVGTVLHNARAKYVATRSACLEGERPREPMPILAADTLVWFEGELIGKPRDLDEAKVFLLRFSGKTQIVFTAVAMGTGAEPELRVEASSVRFKILDEAEICAYVAQVHLNLLDRAGAFDIDESGERLIAGWSGSYTNIMGLPEEVVRGWLERLRL